MDSNNFFSKVKEGDNSIIMYVLGVVLSFGGYFIGQVPLFLVSLNAVSSEGIGSERLNDFMKTMDFSILGIDKNFGLFLLILMFVFAIAGLWLALRIQKKRIQNLISPNGGIDFKRILFGFGIWIVLGLVTELINYLTNPGDYTLQFSFGPFVVLLLISVLLLPIQTSFEELFFRGYLMQGFSLLKNNKLLVMVITSVLFALVHGTNPEISEYGAPIMMTYYVLAGFFLALITVMDGRLELALGIHAATNMYGTVISSYGGGVLQTDSLMKTSSINPYFMTLAFLITGSIAYFIFARKYQWPNISEILKPIDI
ncbi:MAG: CPBP family intramembrane metalloprotease [Saprospiraceae bacterium]|nr:CPBP family intramembrane metalloprotease [Saprospiraceae bacterium]